MHPQIEQRSPAEPQCGVDAKRQLQIPDGFLVPAAGAYALSTWACAFPIWRRDPALFPAVPFAFAVHHATYFAGLVAGISRGVLGRRSASVEAAR